MRPTAGLEIAIIGAGPYGLSIAAHLAHAGLQPRVFGKPMETWATAMPAGMLLKSAAAATNLSDPVRRFTLEAFCGEQGLKYHPLEMPLPVELFTAYGRAFQKRYVPQLEETFVKKVARLRNGFELTLEDGTCFRAAHVVVATGIRRFGSLPTELDVLPPKFVSHSSDSADLSSFKEKDVVVLGGGSSAMDVAAALHRSGARATLVARRSTLRFPPVNGPRRWYHAIRAPMTPLGPGWNKVLACKGPLAFHRMPLSLRQEVVRRYLGPSPTLSVKDTIHAHVRLVLGARLMSCRVAEERLAIDVDYEHGIETIRADHLIAATGYRIDIRRLGFLDQNITDNIKLDLGYPALSTSFESTIPGLYFAGTPSAVSFGPLLRFVCGARFCAQRVTRHLGLETAKYRRIPVVHAALETADQR